MKSLAVFCAAVANGGGCRVECTEANMLEYARDGAVEPAFDAAVTSFAAHHLSLGEK